MKKLLFFLILLGLGGVLAYVFFQKGLVVKKVRCVSQFGPCSEEAFEAVSIIEGETFTEAKRILKNTVIYEGMIIDYSVKIELPATFEVYVIEAKPIIALSKTSVNSYSLVDETGKVLSIVEGTQLPVLQVDSVDSQKLNVGEKLDEDVAFGVNLLEALFEMYSVKTAIFDENLITINVSGGKEVIFPTDGDINVLIGRLQLILSGLNTNSEEFRIDKEGELPRTIDLRYANPVVRY